MIHLKIDKNKLHNALTDIKLRQFRIFRRIAKKAVEELLEVLGKKIRDNMINNIELQKTGCAKDYNDTFLVGDGYLDKNEEYTIEKKGRTESLIAFYESLIDEFNYEITIQGNHLHVQLTEGSVNKRGLTPLKKFNYIIAVGVNYSKNYKEVNPKYDDDYMKIIKEYVIQEIARRLKKK